MGLHGHQMMEHSSGQGQGQDNRLKMQALKQQIGALHLHLTYNLPDLPTKLTYLPSWPT